MLNSLAQALDLSAGVLLDQAGLIQDVRAGDTAGKPTRPAAAGSGKGTETEAAIRADERLSREQKRALIAVYRSYVEDGPGSADSKN